MIGAGDRAGFILGGTLATVGLALAGIVAGTVPKGTDVAGDVWFLASLAVAFFGVAVLAVTGAVHARAWLVDHRRPTTSGSDLHPVPAGHAELLRRVLDNVQPSVRARTPVDYGDGDGAPLHRNVVAAHFPELANQLSAWDDLLNRLQTNRQLIKEHLMARAQGLSITRENRYEVDRIVDYLNDTMLQRAADNQLGTPISFPWLGFEHLIVPWPNAPVWIVTDFDQSEPIELYRARVNDLTGPIDALAREAATWEQCKFVAKLTVQRDQTASSLTERIRLAKLQEPILVAPNCPICRANPRS